MANASKKKIGKGAHGKLAGSGAMTNADDVATPAPNAVLSNRDKAQHPKERGLDSRAVSEEQQGE
jgi:hypothetical protein